MAPKNCGYIKAKGKRYQVKSDQLRCRKARKVATRFMRGRGSGKFTCTRYSGSSNVKAQCRKGQAVIFVIRR